MTNDSKQSDQIPRYLFIGLVIASIASAVLDLMYEKHPHVKFEGWFNFYGFFAGTATLGLVLLALAVRNLIARRENYYDG